MSDLTATKELLREAIGKHQALPLDVQQLGVVAEIMATCIGMAVQERDTLQSKLTEMESVLAWASENVESLTNLYARGTWRVERWTMPHVYAPTLYAALKSAWEGRDK